MEPLRSQSLFDDACRFVYFIRHDVFCGVPRRSRSGRRLLERRWSRGTFQRTLIREASFDSTCSCKGGILAEIKESERMHDSVKWLEVQVNSQPMWKHTRCGKATSNHRFANVRWNYLKSAIWRLPAICSTLHAITCPDAGRDVVVMSFVCKAWSNRLILFNLPSRDSLAYTIIASQFSFHVPLCQAFAAMLKTADP